ncbi:hypothetical protein V8G54_019012 [Vigna mungo]|uniref:FAR1-related sequence 11-like HTH-like domain-containing protein n=1 Tax=Vigna mungo TaxID=3915 RepID=A0AAQ3NA62_VIGMU
MKKEEERLSFWKVPSAKEVVERGIGNCVDKVVMSINNSQHRYEKTEDDEIEEILNELLLEGEYVNDSTLYKGKLFNAYRDILINDQARILLLSKVGCSVSLIMRVLEAEKGIEAGHLPFLDKDIRNFIKSQSSNDKDNYASDVLKLCKGLKDKYDAFQYDFTLDENNKLEHIIWVFCDSIRAYEAFGDVVVFNTTYRINRYDMPLGLWVGVDNHGNSIFLVLFY